MLRLEEIAFQLTLDDVSDNDAANIVREVWNSERKTQKRATTALDRLENAFAQLESQGVMARHYPALGRSDAFAIIDAELAEAAHRGTPFTSYCFYDQVEVDDDALSFSFGPSMNWPLHRQVLEEQLATGNKVAAALSQNGLQVEWSGDASSVIHALNPKWDGARHDDGTPVVKVGPRLPTKRAPMPSPSRSHVRSTFVACEPGSTLGHAVLFRLIAIRGGTSFGKHSATATAAGDYRHGEAVIELLAGPSARPLPPVAYLSSSRELVARCQRLLFVTESAEAEPPIWWDQFEESARLIVNEPRGSLDTVLAWLEA